MFDGMAKPMPEPPATIAVLMPITSPCMFTSGPPELPGLIAASVWRKSSNGPWPIWRALALMIPAVTVACRPNGDPTASTQSPTWTRSESPTAAAGPGRGAGRVRSFARARRLTRDSKVSPALRRLVFCGVRVIDPLPPAGQEVVGQGALPRLAFQPLQQLGLWRRGYGPRLLG